MELAHPDRAQQLPQHSFLVSLSPQQFVFLRSCFKFDQYENHDIAMAMSSSRADSVLGLNFQFWTGQTGGI